jgi:hypothetical protein
MDGEIELLWSLHIQSTKYLPHLVADRSWGDCFLTGLVVFEGGAPISKHDWLLHGLLKGFAVWLVVPI